MKKVLKKYRKFYFLLLTVFLSSNLSAQQKKVYFAAFKYFKNQYESKEITVSPIISHINLSDFAKEISLEWRKNTDSTLKILDSIDHAQENYKAKCRSLEKLNTRMGKIVMTLYFSNIVKNMLVAELFEYRDKLNVDYLSQTKFNQGIRYLFILDEKKNIKKVFHLTMQYN